MNFPVTKLATNHIIPSILYGTAWKKDRTRELVKLAIINGFRAIDTACQPKHYREDLVGDALVDLYNDNIIKRHDIFIQTKFTPFNGQDPNNIPYNPKDTLTNQVKQSIQTSLNNLHTDYIDSLLLHSPLTTFEQTIEVYNTLETYYNNKIIFNLGISNIYDVQLLKRIYDTVTIKPKCIQNRFYAESGYDVEIREFCKEHDMVYQSFWTLTANPHIIKRYVL